MFILNIFLRNYLTLAIPLLLLSLLLTSCAQTPKKETTPPKVALVLGGGGARGFAHVGVIRELEKEKIPLNLIVGVSVGSLIGALYADNPDSLNLEWKAFKISKKEIFDFNLLKITDGLAKGDAIQNYLNKTLTNKYLENLAIPLAVVAVDLNTGKRVIFRKGSIIKAVRASTSLPGIFPPLLWDNKLLVDGGVLGNLPYEVARELGADIIIGVNIAKERTDLETKPPNALTVILESISIMGDEIIRLNHSNFSVLIKPEVSNIGITDFSQKKALIDAGCKATKEAIPKIKRLLKEYETKI